MQGPFEQPTREAQVLALAAEGMTDKQIAADLGISMATVDTYWRRVRARFGTASRTEAVAQALNLRWAETFGLMRDENDRLIREMKEHEAIEHALRDRIEDQRVMEAALNIDIGRLLENAWRSRMLVASLGAVMWWADAQHPWNIEWISDSVLQWGYEPPEFKAQKPILHLVYEDDRISFEAGTLLACRSPMKPLDREYRILTKSGEIRQVRERLVAAVHPSSEAPRLVGIQMDIEPLRGNGTRKTLSS